MNEPTGLARAHLLSLGYPEKVVDEFEHFVRDMITAVSLEETDPRILEGDDEREIRGY